jgi:hypothetical protein
MDHGTLVTVYLNIGPLGVYSTKACSHYYFVYAIATNRPSYFTRTIVTSNI